jgi:heme o synthase
MTPASQAAAPSEFAAPHVDSAAHALHAPAPGATATLIHDLRELFKVKVVGLVLVTGWGGFYLGSMQSGISTLQRGLLDTLLGIGLISAGAGALNQALERTSDARMRRTADRPLASGRWPLTVGIIAGLGAVALGAVWLALHTNMLTVALALLTAFTYVAIYTPLKRVTSLATFIGAFPGAMGPMLGWTAARGRVEWPAVALFAILFVWQFPHFMSIAWLYRDEYARAGIRMLPVVQPDGWATVVEARLLRRAHDSRQPRPVVARNHRRRFTPIPAVRTWPCLSRVHASASRAFSAPSLKTKAASWPATSSRSACFTCRCSSLRSCSAPARKVSEHDRHRPNFRFPVRRRSGHRRHPAHQRRSLALPLLAHLYSSRRGHECTIRLSPRHERGL